MAPPRTGFQVDNAEADVTIWKEALFGAEFLLLHASPVYYGLGVPRGDGSAVVLVPGFLGTDAYLTQLRSWLARIGYRPYFSGIGFNADCPNILIQRKLNEIVERALMETERKIHVIGHSLGGILASPFRGTVAHPTVLRAAETVRKRILKEHGPGVLPTCYTGRCTCNFLDSLRRQIPDSVLETAVYTRNDGVVDWQYCITGRAGVDFEVPGTHIGLAFNASAYTIIANRLAQAQSEE